MVATIFLSLYKSLEYSEKVVCFRSTVKNIAVLRLDISIFRVKTIPKSCKKKKNETKVVGCNLSIDKVGTMFTFIRYFQFSTEIVGGLIFFISMQ